MPLKRLKMYNFLKFCKFTKIVLFFMIFFFFLKRAEEEGRLREEYNQKLNKLNNEREQLKSQK